jgi:hypothetical protein
MSYLPPASRYSSCALDNLKAAFLAEHDHDVKARLSTRSRRPTVAAIFLPTSVNERMGAARSLSTGRALRGAVGVFARPYACYKLR